MNQELSFHFNEALRIIDDLAKDFPVNRNPMEMRIAPLLAEQKLFLWNALTLIKQGIPDLEQFKSILSILYRSNEAFDPIYRGWIRASKWMQSAPAEFLSAKLKLNKQLRNQLVQAVPHIQTVFGEKETRFIIPPLIRSDANVSPR